jgi:hypothetical protein
MAYPTDEQIRSRAHQLWEDAGRPEGRADEFWHQAERDLADAGYGSDEMTEPTPTVFPR